MVRKIIRRGLKKKIGNLWNLTSTAGKYDLTWVHMILPLQLQLLQRGSSLQPNVYHLIPCWHITFWLLITTKNQHRKVLQVLHPARDHLGDHYCALPGSSPLAVLKSLFWLATFTPFWTHALRISLKTQHCRAASTHRSCLESYLERLERYQKQKYTAVVNSWKK